MQSARERGAPQILPGQAQDLFESIESPDASKGSNVGELVQGATIDAGRRPLNETMVFDRDGSKPWDEKLYRREESLDGRAVAVWGA